MVKPNIQYLAQDDMPNEATAAIEHVVSKLPESIREFVEYNVLWVTPYDEWGFCQSFHLQKGDKRRFTVDPDGPMSFATWQIRIVHLAFALWKEPESKQRHTVAHEIAHLWLRHESTNRSNSTESYNRNEDEADALAVEWGFPRPADTIGDNLL